MKKILFPLLLLTLGLGAAGAQDATTLQVAPSDQIKYPDASQILNKVEPKAPVVPKATTASKAVATTPATAPVAAPAAVPSNKPLVAAVPILASQTTPAAATVAKPVSPSAHGWFLRWLVAGDEPGVRTWAQTLGRDYRLAPAGTDRWEVLAGPLDGPGLSAALAGQAGRAELVKR